MRRAARTDTLRPRRPAAKLWHRPRAVASDKRRLWTSAFGKSMSAICLCCRHVVSRYTVNSSCSASKASDLWRGHGARVWRERCPQSGRADAKQEGRRKTRGRTRRAVGSVASSAVTVGQSQWVGAWAAPGFVPGEEASPGLVRGHRGPGQSPTATDRLRHRPRSV